jgi:Holliday junction resolvase
MSLPYVNKFDKNGTCSLQGINAEKTFKDILLSEGFSVREATLKEQMTHVDFIVTFNNQVTRYEVKSRKKINRNDNKFQDELIWIEIQNVRGDLGWLYGSADYIVFEREKDFVVVDREKLADFIALKCNLRKTARSASEALYIKYQRWGRNDCLTLIQNSDIESLAKKIYLK